MEKNVSGSAPIVLPLWPEEVPGCVIVDQQEEEILRDNGTRVVRNVVQPTVTIHLPSRNLATGTAAVVCPGGAYHYLSIDREGRDVARWLASKGIAVGILKYRLIKTGNDFPACVQEHLSDRAIMRELMEPLLPMAVADGQQAVRIIRTHAKNWGILPDRIGIIGFSAGGSVAVNVALEHTSDSRPDFAGVIYGAGSKDTQVPDDAPPLFVLCAADDDMAIPISIQLFTKWKESGHPSELHIYSKGGHGFGMMTRGLPTDSWIDRFYDWLREQGAV